MPKESAFGKLLREFRLKSGTTQETLAERTSMSFETISALERGTRRYPYSDTIDRLAQALLLSSADRDRLRAAAKRPSILQQASNGADDLNRVESRTNLVGENTSFIGRERLIDEITLRLETHRLITLTGAGGIGKTRIAREVGGRKIRSYEDGAWFVDLAPIRDNALVIDTIAAGIGAHTTSDASLSALLAYLRIKRLLLIVDNCEHVIRDAAEIVDQIVRDCLNVHVIATSRERFKIANEWVFRVPPLPVPDLSSNLRPLEETLGLDAVKLFIERASAAAGPFQVSEQAVTFALTICRQLNGIPLAIELAASRVVSLSLADISSSLSDHLTALSIDSRSTLQRHRTMRSVIDWSYDLLDDQERLCFERLACFAGSFTLQAAVYVCNFGKIVLDPHSPFAALVEKSMILVEPVRGSVRYRMLGTTRAYARERLLKSGDEFTVNHRLAQWTDNEFTGLYEIRLTTARVVWIARATVELDNARYVFDWALSEPGFVSFAFSIFRRLRGLWWESGRLGEGARWLSRIEERLNEGDELDLAEYWFQKSLLETGRLAVACASKAATLYERVDEYDGIVNACLTTAIGFLQMSDYRSALLASERALSIASTHGLSNTLFYAAALSLQASSLGGLQKFAEARDASARCIALTETLGDYGTAANERLILAELEFAQGNVEEALSLSERALLAFKVSGGPLTGALLNGAAYSIVLGKIASAWQLSRRALRLACRSELALFRTVAIQHLAALHALDGRYTRAGLLAGYTDCLYDRLGAARETTELATFRILESELVARIGPDEFVRLRKAGSTLSDNEAMTMALDDGVTRLRE